MYIKDKEKVFKCIPLYTMCCFREKYLKIYQRKETIVLI